MSVYMQEKYKVLSIADSATGHVSIDDDSNSNGLRATNLTLTIRSAGAGAGGILGYFRINDTTDPTGAKEEDRVILTTDKRIEVQRVCGGVSILNSSGANMVVEVSLAY